MTVITSPAGAVAKYCDEHACLCLYVCLSVREDIPEPHARILTIFVQVAYGRGWVLFRRRCDMLCTFSFVG